ncbi:MAG: hypothetical protein WD009_02375 [Phycisphaeraceae bacterium]
MTASRSGRGRRRGGDPRRNILVATDATPGRRHAPRPRRGAAPRSASNPPVPLPRGVRPRPDADAGVRYEADGEFVDHARREEADDQPELRWDD